MYTIGRLARRAKVNADSIRFYERQGLLAPETKTHSGYRLYTDDALRRIVFIKHAQRCGFSLADIVNLLHIDCGSSAERRSAHDLAAQKRGEIQAAIESLQAMSSALACVLASGTTDQEAAYPRQDSSLISSFEARLGQHRASRAAHDHVAIAAAGI